MSDKVSVDRGGQRRPGMVERPLHSVEWSEPESSQLLPHHRDRCLEKRVGAVCDGVHTGGPEERTMHINCLELLAAYLAVKCFVLKEKNKPDHTSQVGQFVSTDIATSTNKGGQSPHS